jgi:hypothetical protein
MCAKGVGFAVWERSVFGGFRGAMKPTILLEDVAGDRTPPGIAVKPSPAGYEM